MADAYRTKQDTTLGRAIRLLSDDPIAGKQYETEGVNYAAGDVVLAEDISPALREQAENGELDNVLEPISRDEYDEAKAKAGAVDRSTFIAEHEAERVILEDYGHRVVERSQALDLVSAGADAAREAMEEAKEAGLDERPNLTAKEVPSPREAGAGEARAVEPREPGEPIPAEQLEGVEQPPGLPVGNDLARASGAEVDEAKPRRARPSAGKKKTDDEAPSE